VDYRVSLERLTSEINQRLSTQAGAAVAYVDGWVEMNLKMLRQYAALDEMASMDPKKQQPILRSVLNEYRWTYLIFTIGLDGMNVARSYDEALRDYSDRVYVRQVLGGAPMGQQVVISRTTGQPSFILSVPIAAKGKLAGVLAVGTGVTELSATWPTSGSAGPATRSSLTRPVPSSPTRRRAAPALSASSSANHPACRVRGRT
jgi:methyl-accepting chemotaxis protein